MPCDDRTVRALAVLSPARASFRDAVVNGVGELSGYIAAHRPSADAKSEIVAGLGRFAAGRLDGERFAELFAGTGRLTPEELERLELALATLREFAAAGDELYRIVLPRGADLRDSVRNALAARGSVFAAARGAERIRSGLGIAADDETGGYAFRHWNRAERQIAPPLAVEVDGGDVLAGGLAEYLEGRVKLVLVVTGQSAPAPLARLIAPHVFVQQAADADGLAAFARFDGPGIAALVPAGAALFTHDPAAGPRLGQRLSVASLPEQEPRYAFGSVSVAQQQADLQWLRELRELAAQVTMPTAGGDESAAPTEPVDMLAAWLLRQTDLGGV